MNYTIVIFPLKILQKNEKLPKSLNFAKEGRYFTRF